VIAATSVLDLFAPRLGIAGIHVHDSSAISYLIAPRHYTWGRTPDPRGLRTQLLTRQDVARQASQRPRGLWQGQQPLRILTEVDPRA
jgi:hypothetical protein